MSIKQDCDRVINALKQLDKEARGVAANAVADWFNDQGIEVVVLPFDHEPKKPKKPKEKTLF